MRGGEQAATMTLAWLAPPEWHALVEKAGFAVEALYGWFDRRPYAGQEDFVFVAGRD